MPVLTLAEIIATCTTVTDRAEKYQPLQHTAFLTLQRTGCREGEVCDLTRWRLTQVGTYELTTEKGQGIRTFEAVDLPMQFRQWIAGRQNGRAPTSTDRLRSAFRQMCPLGQLRVGSKGISTHLYRYAFIRSLEAEGRTVAEIKEIMALSSTRVVQGYLGNDVIGGV
jgi:integrase